MMSLPMGEYLGRMPPKEPHFEIIYKSNKYVVVNKPFDTCIDGDDREFTVKKHLINLYPELNGEVRFVNRIDYATSGIVLTGSTKKDTNIASQLFQKRETHKEYLALVWGHALPLYDGERSTETEITIDLPIADDQTDPNAFKMCIGSEGNPGRHSKTHIRVLEHGYYNNKPASKVHLFPHTGRRHQLRVHLAHFGHVIIGDETYGPKDSHCFRMMLHSWKLTIPFKEETLNFETQDPFISLLSDKPETTEQTSETTELKENESKETTETTEIIEEDNSMNNNLKSKIDEKVEVDDSSTNKRLKYEHES